MALTIIFSLAGAALFALFVVPVLATLLFQKGYREWENPVLKKLSTYYGILLGGFIHHRHLVITSVTGALIGLLILIMPRLGTEFLPYMDEGVIWVRANFPEGTSLQQASRFGRDLRGIALEFSDIQFVTVQTGRSDSGTDPFPPSRLEMMIGPKPRDTWIQFQRKSELVAALGDRFRNEFPTVRFNFTQPIIDSVTEDSNGTSASMAIEFSGADLDILLDLARRAESLLKEVPGAVDVYIEQEGPQPQLVIQPDRSLCARYNVRIEDVIYLIDTAIGGAPIGTLFEGERRFDIKTRFAPEYLRSPEAIGRLPVYNPDGVPIPLSQVAWIKIIDGQTMIARADGRRHLTVRSDIVGRDQGGFVADAQHRLTQELKFR